MRVFEAVEGLSAPCLRGFGGPGGFFRVRSRLAASLFVGDWHFSLVPSDDSFTMRVGWFRFGEGAMLLTGFGGRKLKKVETRL